MKNALSKTEKNAFTLVEILVVMSIIAILSSLLFAGSRRALVTARNTEAAAGAQQLRNAIVTYQTEYRRLPIPSGNTGGEDHIDIVSDEDIMDILMAADDNERNPRGVVFYSGKTATTAGGKGVFLNEDGGGTLRDPFRSFYGIRLDTSGRQRMSNPSVNAPSGTDPSWGTGSTSNNAPSLIAESIAVWSQGPEADSSSDNITTW